MLAHKLVDLFPEWVISWFAVGSYYFLVGKQEHARRYLSRATQLDRVFGPSWLAYGHSFALGKRLVEISKQFVSNAGYIQINLNYPKFRIQNNHHILFQ